MEPEHNNKNRGRRSAVRVAFRAASVALVAGFITFILGNLDVENHAIAALRPFFRRSSTEALAKMDIEVGEGGIIRGPRKEKKIALEFTGHNFAEGGETILNELAKHHAKASFFLTGDFLDNPEFKPLVWRIVREGHYLGPHSDKHLLYCPWTGPKKTLVTREAFDRDLSNNSQKIWNLIRKIQPSIGRSSSLYWLPAYEWYNQEIVDWSRDNGYTLVNYTPGTRSNADYTEEASTNFVSSKIIYDSIIKKEQSDPSGLNGFLLLMHIGAGLGRADKMHDHLGELLDYLTSKGYQFVRVDELLNPNEGPGSNQPSFRNPDPGRRRVQ